MIDPTRRRLLGGLPLALAGTALADGSPATAAGASVPTSAAPRPATAASDAARAARAVGSPVPAGPLADGFIDFPDAAARFRALFRFERDLRDEGTALSTYHFLVFAFPGGERPRPVVRFEGMEFSYFRRIADTTWRIHAHNLSYPRDVQAGRFVSQVRNPFTGEMLEVRPMRLLEDPGILHSPRGYLRVTPPDSDWLDSFFVARIEGDLVKAEHIRPAPASWPKIFMESWSNSVPRRDFEDPRITSLMYQTSGFYSFPFPAWVRMGSTPGHMLGAWNGRKIREPGDLPREFLARARAEDAALLEPRWSEFDRPLAPRILEKIAAK
jgi:hypothetical protein